MSYTSFSGEEYFSVEDYIQQSIDGNVPWLCFKDLDDFQILLEKGLLKIGCKLEHQIMELLMKCIRLPTTEI